MTHKKDKTLTQALQPFVDNRIVAGVVALVATQDEIVSHEAIGWSDISSMKPMTLDSLFWIASMTKPITATAFMMLVDEGKISVDDPVEKYLSEFKGQMMIAEEDDDHRILRKPQHPILVREILSHTAGLPFSSPVEKPFLDGLRLETAVRSYAMLPLQVEPGTKYLYSNCGTNMVGRLIEVISNQSYETFMNERLFHPLGMIDTTFWPSREQLQRYAKVYRATPDNSGLEECENQYLTPPFDNLHRFPMPAGGLFSTAKDVLKFCQMIRNGGVFENRRYISSPAIHEMTRKQTGEGIETRYGFGWGSEPKFGHGGAYKTNMTIYSTSGLITILLMHYTGPWRDESGNKIASTFEAFAEDFITPA